jgi:hypothetical protein
MLTGDVSSFSDATFKRTQFNSKFDKKQIACASCNVPPQGVTQALWCLSEFFRTPFSPWSLFGWLDCEMPALTCLMSWKGSNAKLWNLLMLLLQARFDAKQFIWDVLLQPKGTVDSLVWLDSSTCYFLFARNSAGIALQRSNGTNKGPFPPQIIFDKHIVLRSI